MTEHLNRELFLDEPTKEDLFATVISVDDHLVEPPTMFEGRLEARFQHLAPKVIETELGHQVWEFDGATYSQRPFAWNPFALSRCDLVVMTLMPESPTWT